MTEEKIRWISGEKRKQAAFVTLLCLSSALIAFAPRNERRLFTVPEQPGSIQTLAAPEETLARSEIFGAIGIDGRRFGDRGPQGFFAGSTGGPESALRDPAAIRRLASGVTPAALAANPVVDNSPSALFAQPVVDSPAAAAGSAPGSDGGSGGGGGGGGGGGSTGAAPLALVPPSSANPAQQDNPVAAIPEPATWLMMMAGFGAAGWVMRRRAGRQVAVSSRVA